jgi:hypothetical protein
MAGRALGQDANVARLIEPADRIDAGAQLRLQQGGGVAAADLALAGIIEKDPGFHPPGRAVIHRGAQPGVARHHGVIRRAATLEASQACG